MEFTLSNNSLWQHIDAYNVRNASGLLFQVSARPPSTIAGAAEPTSNFILSLADETSVLYLGMLGAHFHRRWRLYAYLAQLKTRLVDRFPGKVTVIGPSMQHFMTRTGHYESATACTPATPDGRKAYEETRAIYAAVFGNNFVDITDAVVDSYALHRTPTDCTHWKDTVYDSIKKLAAIATPS
jgi:hypothetical protein